MAGFGVMEWVTAMIKVAVILGIVVFTVHRAVKRLVGGERRSKFAGANFARVLIWRRSGDGKERGIKKPRAQVCSGGISSRGAFKAELEHSHFVEGARIGANQPNSAAESFVGLAYHQRTRMLSGAGVPPGVCNRSWRRPLAAVGKGEAATVTSGTADLDKKHLAAETERNP
jgi:hypothetical protein